MRFHKINMNERKVYRYPIDVEDGHGGYVKSYITIRAGENEVTEADIALLHRMDDNEVTCNIRNSRPKVSEERKMAILEWRRKYIEKFKSENGYEPALDTVDYAQEQVFPKNWNLSTDALIEEGIDEDKSSVLAGGAYEQDFDTLFDYKRVLEIVSEMNPEQIELFNRVFIKGESQASAARAMGIKNRQSVTKRINRIKEYIKKKF